MVVRRFQRFENWVGKSQGKRVRRRFPPRPATVYIHRQNRLFVVPDPLIDVIVGGEATSKLMASTFSASFRQNLVKRPLLLRSVEQMLRFTNLSRVGPGFVKGVENTRSHGYR